jgi:alpha-maltose-1-phosphate synthase
MRVAIVCDWFLKYAVRQAIGLRHQDVDVVLVCRDHAHEFGGSAAERGELLEEARTEGVEVLTVHGRVASPARLAETVGLRRRLLAWGPEIVHAHDNTDPALLAICAGIPRVVTVHDPAPHPGAPKRSVVKRAVRQAWMRHATLVAHGDSLAEELTRASVGADVSVIPHGSDVVSEPYARPERPRVLFFGRMEVYKGLPVLLRAMEQVWQERPDAELVVSGVGPESKALPADPRIVATDRYVPEAELDAMFRESSLVVLPYVEASQSGVGALAVGRGVPVVVSRTGALPDLAPSPAFVVPPSDAAALATAILSNLDHDDDLRRRIWRRASELFAWDVVAARTTRVYESVLARSKA